MSNTMESNVDSTAVDVLIEEINSNEISETELLQFQETEPLEVVDIIEDVCAEENGGNGDDDDGDVEEGTLINRYLQGKGSFPELYTKVEPGEEDLEALSDAADNENDSDIETVDASITDTRPSTSALQSRQENVINAVSSLLDNANKSRKTGNTCSGRRSVLNATLRGLMGEANIKLARGDAVGAECICMEVIRLNPLACEPFYTLAQIYEGRDASKFINILTIAAHLNPHDRETWIRIADMHIAQNNLQAARVAYTKAIKALYKDYDLRYRKGKLLENMDDLNAAMCSYLRMLSCIPPPPSELCLKLANRVARHFHNLKKPILALEAMANAYNICGARFSLEDLNLYLELLILNKSYETVLKCLRERTNVEIETVRENNLGNIQFCVIPDDYVPDLRSKLCVALIHLHAHHLLGYLVQNVQEHIPVVAERIELYMDITEALMQEHKYAEAISLMLPITEGDTIECPAFVWLRQAECLRQLNRTNEAIEAYTRVVDMAPYCYDAKFTLSAMLKQQGRHVEAVKALEQSGEGEGQPLHARLLYERCIMLQQIGRIDEFLEVGYVLLGRQSIDLRNREEMLAVATGVNYYNADSVKTILQLRRNITEEDATKTLQKVQAEQSDLTTQDEYCLFLQLVRTAYEHAKYSAIQRLCFAMVTTKRFSNFHIDLERITILACYFNDDPLLSFFYLRELINKQPSNVVYWNLLSLLIQKGENLRYFRYSKRLMVRHQVPRIMRLFHGHYHINCSSYKYALNVYVPILRETNDPLTALCIAAVFNQMAMQKRVLRKTAAVGQAIGFAHKYAELRMDDNGDNSAAQQEILYNIGRIYHQAGITYLALEYYERALAVKHDLIEKYADTLGLQHEIAFNLHLIYRASGNKWKARELIYKYCVI